MIADATNDTALVTTNGQPHRFKPGHKHSPRKLNTTLSQLVEFADVLYFKAFHEKLPADDLAALARAFCLLDERIRIRRGIPLPGQLRPDLPPMKGARLRRGKGAPILEVAAHAQQFTEALTRSDQAAGEPLQATGPEVNATAIETRATPTPTPTTTPAKKRNPFEKLKRVAPATPKTE